MLKPKLLYDCVAASHGLVTGRSTSRSLCVCVEEVGVWDGVRGESEAEEGGGERKPRGVWLEGYGRSKFRAE